jgi:hypothetical protein
VALVDSVRESGGEVKIFSSMHVSGERKLILHRDSHGTVKTVLALYDFMLL